jgi:hypothetical protein
MELPRLVTALAGRGKAGLGIPAKANPREAFAAMNR